MVKQVVFGGCWVGLCLLSGIGMLLAAESRPNILWFVVDDMSPNFACYGETTIQTPHVDGLAKQGVQFLQAYITAPVCSPCRSALITGMYQTTIGSHQHRSGRGELKIHLPEGVVPVPQLFQAAGYYTCIGRGIASESPRGAAKGKKGKGGGEEFGKTDYNFEWDQTMYDGDDWSGRRQGQPFFMQVQMSGGKLREGSPDRRAAFRQRVIADLGSATDPAAVNLPPYYPRDPVLLEDWALYLDAVRYTDKLVGDVLKRLDDEGLTANTLVIFMTDHGISHARGKQFLYDEGTHIPLVVRGPGVAAGVQRSDLVEHIDVAAISLAAAGIPLPAKMQGRPSLSPGYQPRQAVFAARDRCDETIDRIRSMRSEEYLYIRNFYPERPHLQPNAYKDGKAIVQQLRALHAAGRLEALSEQLLFNPTRPAEELYAYRRDRWQVTNLAKDPTYAEILQKHRAGLDRWLEESQDQGAEAEAMYDSDMREYLRKPNPEVEANIRQMKAWAAAGK
jgi:arylsulfatase A-like enzyme